MFYQPLSLSVIASKLQSGGLNLINFVNEVCDRIDAIEPHVRALIPEDNRRERLLREAESLLQKFPNKKKRPTFFGIPVGVKDIFRADGFATRCGSKLPCELFRGPEASCVQKLKEAGALILGKTVTTEFAYFQPGPTRNPNNVEYTPGGSSSGSAAAVAAGFTPFALGTQTIGSIARPAAYCGIVGFKPSYGRIATDGVIPFAQSVDHVGFFVNDLDSCSLAASLLCNNWKENAAKQPNRSKPIIGVPEGEYLMQASDEILQHFEEALKQFAAKGFTTKRVSLFADIENINKNHRLIAAAEMARVHNDWYEAHKNLYSQHSTEIIEEGKTILAVQLEAAKKNRLTARNEIETTCKKENIDLWVSPATLTTPPRGLESTGSPLMNLPWTFAGLPTVTIPFRTTANNLPVGIQFCGTFNNDETLLNHVAKLQ